jgi:hypothetical protein
LNSVGIRFAVRRAGRNLDTNLYLLCRSDVGLCLAFPSLALSLHSLRFRLDNLQVDLALSKPEIRSTRSEISNPIVAVHRYIRVQYIVPNALGRPGSVDKDHFSLSILVSMNGFGEFSNNLLETIHFEGRAHDDQDLWLA